MKRALASQTLFFLFFFLMIAQSALGSLYCQSLFSSKNLASEASVSDQEKIREHEAQVNLLMIEYTQKLGPFWDPFAVAWSQKKGEIIFQTLLSQPNPGSQKQNLLYLISREFSQVYINSPPYNERLIENILADSWFLLKQPLASKETLQSNLLALKYTREYIKRFRVPDSTIDRDGDKIKQETKSNHDQEKKSEEQEPKSEKKEQEDLPPEYPDLPKEYKPSTKNTQNQGNSGKKEHPVAEVNFKTPFFAQRHYSSIARSGGSPFQEIALPTSFSHPGKYRSTDLIMITRTYGKQNVDLFIPPGFKPLQPEDPRAFISRSETGSYSLELKGGLEDIEIPLVENTGIQMMPHIREIYTRPVGFSLKEWPDQIQASVIRRFNRKEAETKPLQIAQAIAEHLANEYLYSVGAQAEADPIQALKQGSFQCDMAAYIMVSLLRDVYQIPSRVVAGYRAKKHRNHSSDRSYLIPTDSAHAWIEVFYDGRWHSFDPTPVKKDRKDSQNSESDYTDNVLPNTPKPKPEEEKSKGKKTKDKTNPSKSEPKTQDEEENNSNSTKKDEAKEISPNPKTSITREELADQLELGSLELEPKSDRNALYERAVRTLLKIALEPTLPGIEIQNRLNKISSLIQYINSPSTQTVLQKSLSVHEKAHPELKNWIDELIRLLPSRDLNETYHELYKIRNAVELYSKLLDLDGRIPYPEKLLATIKEIQDRMRDFAHPDSQDIEIVQDFTKNLPNLVRQLLNQLYDLTQVGPNQPTRKVAELLKSGELSDLRLLSILSPLSDFILNSTPRPEYVEIKTWLSDQRKQTGRDLLPLQRFTDMPRALLGQPGKSIEENIRSGTAYVPKKRQTVKIPAGYGREEAERVTIVLYDTSGSMNGNPGRFQAGLISAFTARALSDISPAGHHRHKVVLVPFDEDPGTPVPVTNSAEALDIIRSYQEKLKNTNGGTNIQKALLQAMSLIADAEQRAGEPLAAANIILMSDGQSEIETHQLLQARKAIDRLTPIQTMFIAINGSNKELINFAMDSQKMGMERGFYREFTPEKIETLLNQADHLNTEEGRGFYSEHSAKDLPDQVYRLFDNALRYASEFSDQIYYGSQYIPASEHLESLEKLKWRDVQEIDRPLEKWLIRVRQLAMHPVFQDRRLLERVVDDLVIHFERITKIKMDSLSDFEQEQLRHLVRYAAGIEEETR